MKRAILIILNLLFVILPAVPVAGQTTYNLEIIFQRGTPDTSLYYWGSSINGVGDVNGDGYDDVAVGCFIPNTWEPKIYLFYGGPAGIDTIYDLLIEPPITQGQGVLNIAGGDINKDGYSDICVVTAGPKRVWIYYGGSPMNNIAEFSFGGLGLPNYLNWASSTATGDLNGDDTTDLIVGDYWNTNGDGHVYIYKGSAAFDTIPWVEIKGHDLEQFGSAVRSGVDVNNDGYADLVVGAKTYNFDSRGRVYIFNGPLMDTIPDWWKDGTPGEQNYGSKSMMDVAKDSSKFDRLWTSEYYYPGGYWSSDNNGITWLFYGGNPMDSIPDMTIVGSTDSSLLGVYPCGVYNSVRMWSNLACGSFAGEITYKGKGYYWVSDALQDSIVDGWIMGRWDSDFLGRRCASAGDVNGDGKDEIILSNPGADSNEIVVICKYTGPDGVTGEPVNNEQLFINNVLQNAPNPFSHNTTIRYQLTANGHVSLKVYNIAGQVVKTLVNEDRKAGSYEARWDGRDEAGQKVSNGIYFYQLKMEDKSMIKKLTILR